MEEELTIEQALLAIKQLLDSCQGTYKEHLYIQSCYNKILKELNKNK